MQKEKVHPKFKKHMGQKVEIYVKDEFIGIKEIHFVGTNYMGQKVLTTLPSREIIFIDAWRDVTFKTI